MKNPSAVQDPHTMEGRKVYYTGNVGSFMSPMVPYGSIGTIDYASGLDTVMVRWEGTYNKIPQPYYSHSWSEIEILATDKKGNILPGEFERARLKSAPRILELALPCPVCGSKKLSFSEEYGYRQAYCSADYGTCGEPLPTHCAMGGPRISSEFPLLMAIAVWNIRGCPEALTKEIRGFPKGDVEVVPFVDTKNVRKVPCPFCLGTTIKIAHQQDNDSWHGECAGCGAFAPWFPCDYKNRAKSVEDVVRDWKRIRGK